MRCPRCQFVAFRDIAKCPSCGEVFHTPVRGRAGRMARETTTDDDGGPLATYSTVEDVVGPLVDYSLRAPESFVPRSGKRQTRTKRATAGSQDVVQTRRGPAGAKGGSLVEGFEPERNVWRQLQRRFLAGLIDLLLLCSINIAVIYFTTRLVGFPMAEVTQLPLAPLCAFLAVFNVGYAVTLTAIGGQTIGKMAVGLRVEEVDGSRVTPVHALIRTTAYLVSVLPLGLGFAGMFLHSRRALHDLMADTRVVQRS